MIDSKDSSLPNGWKWKKLGEIAKLFAGSSAPQDNKYFSPDGPPFYRVSDVSKYGRTDSLVESANQLSEVALNEFKLVPVKAGTIVFPKSGAAVKTNNRAIIEKDGYLVSHLMAVQAKQDIAETKWLYWYLCQIDLMKYSDNDQYPSLKQSVVEKLKVPLPPLTEQKRIAAILNERLAAIEKARKASEARLEAARTLAAAYLREVFESEESRRWQEVTLGEIALEVQNGIYKSSEFYGEGKPFLRMYNVENTSWHINQNNLAKVIIDANEQTKFELRKGDLLISRVNSHELVGKCAWVTTEEESYVFENMLIRVRLSSDVDSKFVAQQLSTKALKEQIQGKAKRAIGQSSINATDIKQIKIRLPSLKTQSILASQLENDVSHSHQLHKLLKEEYGTVVAMPMALLKQAFSGTL